jgi:hypothetical protein
MTAAAGVLLVIAVITLMGWAILRGIDKQPSVVGSLFTAAAAIAAVVLGQFWSKRLELRQLHRDQMAPVYQELVDRMRGEPGTGGDQFWKDLQRSLLLYCPAEVLTAYLQYQVDFNPDAPTEDPTNLLGWETVLRAIRKDLGHSDGSLRQYDLLRVWVNDLDEHLPTELRSTRTAR